MNPLPNCLLPVATVLFALPVATHGANITFGAPVSIAGEAEVTTVGKLKFAYNWANAPQTVNGVVFAGTNSTTTVGADLAMNWLNGGRSNLTAFAGSGTFTSLPAAYQGILRGSVYAGTSGAGTVSTVTLTGLTVGNSYLVQFWVNDARGGTAGGTRSEMVGSGGDTVTLAYGGSAVGTPGQYAIGTFVADAPTQTLTLTTTSTGNSPTAQMNAIQVRDTSGIGYYWDPSGNAAGLGGSGAWNATASAWTTNSAGTSGSTSYPNASGLATTVGFAGPAGTVTVASGTAINVGSIVFGTTGYTIAGADGTASLTNTSGAGQLTIATGTGNSETITAAITGPVTLVKSNDTGTLLLGGANTYSGGTIINGGTLGLLPHLPPGLQIMPIGDSITYGGSGSNAGYRGYLHALLAPVAPAFQFAGVSTVNPAGLPTSPLDQTHHNGYSSYSSVHLSNNLDGLDRQPYDVYGGASRDPLGGYWLVGGNGTGRAPAFPNLVLLLVGANDIYWNNAQINVAGFPANLTNLLTKILTLRPTARILVADITPWPARSAEVAAINTAVKSVVASFQSQGKAVSEVDLNTSFPASGLSADGLHPNDTGYAWMANQWYSGIVAAAGTSGASGGLPADSAVSVAAGATLSLNGQAQSLDALTGTGTVATGGGALTIGNAGGSFAFGGVISGTGTLLKAGAGTATLTGANSYSGTTSVTQGSLIVNGSMSSSATTSHPGTTLGGTGPVGALTVLAGATLAPGTAGIGTLRAGHTVLAGTCACELDGALCDRLTVTGNLNLAGARLALPTVGGGAVSTNCIIATYTGTLVGTFSNVTPGYSVTYDAANKRILVSTEPFEWWVASFFPGVTDPAITGPEADPDHDGLDNAVEFVLGGQPNPANPNAPSSTLAPVSALDPANLVITYRRTHLSMTQPGIQTGVEYGSNLTGWVPAVADPGGVTVNVTENGFGAGVDKVEVLIPRSLGVGSKLFARLNVSIP